MRWLGKRLFDAKEQEDVQINAKQFPLAVCMRQEKGAEVYLFSDGIVDVAPQYQINASAVPEHIVQSNIADIIDVNADEDLFISPVGCKGILRRADERGMHMNPRLKTIMEKIVASMDDSEIERISRVQPRGQYSLSIESGEREKPRSKRKPKSQIHEIEFEAFQRIAE